MCGRLGPVFHICAVWILIGTWRFLKQLAGYCSTAYQHQVSLTFPIVRSHSSPLRSLSCANSLLWLSTGLCVGVEYWDVTEGVSGSRPRGFSGWHVGFPGDGVGGGGGGQTPGQLVSPEMVIGAAGVSAVDTDWPQLFRSLLFRGLNFMRKDALSFILNPLGCGVGWVGGWGYKIIHEPAWT